MFRYLSRRRFYLITGLLLVPFSISAETLQITVDNFSTQYQKAQAGDQLILAPGVYPAFSIEKPISILGQEGVIVDAKGLGHAVEIKSKNVTLKRLKIINWGEDLTELDSGIFVNRGSDQVVIEDNHLQGNGSGVWVDGALDIRIESNRMIGNPNVRSFDRGNGIHLFNVFGALIKNNHISQTRDGIYIDTSNKNRLVGNKIHDLRYGVHYMYSNYNEVIGNHTWNTRTGYALMQSHHLTVIGNQSKNDQNYGILMNYITYSALKDNRVEGAQPNALLAGSRKGDSGQGGEGKAIFVYNSLFNEIQGNYLANSDLGIHLTAGSKNNKISKNAFVGNRNQVKYVSNKQQEWSQEGVGNYWSDYLGWDMDGNQRGDTAYEPNDQIDRLIWKFPAAKYLFNAPAIELLRWVQRQFPVFKDQGVQDSYPLMEVPKKIQLSLQHSENQQFNGQTKDGAQAVKEKRP
ncbi:nitrous oxide reductase family maturation protein NosD [Pelagibaculum spongiae]|uniref:Copper-binding protein n=1 Tax=Pelagibaculum spongiae TaxID=2080658 RepID=A0A2V1GWF6_9GAMM|nr:nitrous oxide reductase family maturation protein NosD [Pelagibaculum spongiae]PVZ68997.1 copper-binding protein [Pelagibaculum spongiae]